MEVSAHRPPFKVPLVDHKQCFVILEDFSGHLFCFLGKPEVFCNRKAGAHLNRCTQRCHGQNKILPLEQTFVKMSKIKILGLTRSRSQKGEMLSETFMHFCASALFQCTVTIGAGLSQWNISGVQSQSLNATFCRISTYSQLPHTNRGGGE